MLIECGAKRYSLPHEDVVLLPVVNTTTETIAAHLLGKLMTCLSGKPGIRRVELGLAEAADTAATVGAEVVHRR